MLGQSVLVEQEPPGAQGFKKKEVVTAVGGFRSMPSTHHPAPGARKPSGTLKQPGEGQQRAGLAGASSGSDLHPTPRLTLAPAAQVAGEAGLGEACLSLLPAGTPHRGLCQAFERSWEMTQTSHRPALSSSSLRHHAGKNLERNTWQYVLLIICLTIFF